MSEPLISICVPAYKKPQYVVRLVKSVLQQDYKNVEIIISDDSPDEDTKQAILPFQNILSIRYFHNQPALTSPRNWNYALQQAAGELVVLMHQDDWYASESALSTYVDAFRDVSVDFVFCRNTGVDEAGKKVILQAIPSLLNQMAKKPNHLLLAQVIGPPSNTMLRRRVNLRYDERFVWLVDVDYYVRLLKKGCAYRYIEKHLVSIGLHQDQMTEFCRANNHIIFKENVWFAGKLEPEAFFDIRIYDYYWRLLRNDRIRTLRDIEDRQVRREEIPSVLQHMLHLQSRFPTKVLQNGVFSKCLMTWSYLRWRSKR